MRLRFLVRCNRSGRQEQAYVRQNYAWQIVEQRFVDWLNWTVEHYRQLAPELEQRKF
jgi:hypothetical protein